MLKRKEMRKGSKFFVLFVKDTQKTKTRDLENCRVLLLTTMICVCFMHGNHLKIRLLVERKQKQTNMISRNGRENCVFLG